MRPKSGLPKRKALRNMPRYDHGFRENPATATYRHPHVSGILRETDTSVVSLFSGCGGMDLGLLGGFYYRADLYPTLPFRVIAAYDHDPNAVETYRLNISSDIHRTDLTTINMADLPYGDLLVGGFPCQDFSSSGPKKGLDGLRGRLYRVLVAYMRVHRPKVVVAENVPHLGKMKRGAILETILSEFEAVGYDFKVWNLYCPNFGLPQNRSRLFLVGVRRDLPGEPVAPKTTHSARHRPIEWAIEDLEPVTDESIPNQSQYFVATKATAGAGQGDEHNARGDVAYCVRANPKARVHFHYELDRRLTVRECARLQSFPDEFVFPHSTGANIMQIGNAVPPIVANHVGQSLAAYFNWLQNQDDAAQDQRAARPIQMPLLAGA